MLCVLLCCLVVVVLVVVGVVGVVVEVEETPLKMQEAVEQGITPLGRLI